VLLIGNRKKLNIFLDIERVVTDEGIRESMTEEVLKMLRSYPGVLVENTKQ
jgi:hypothetical protein